MAFKMTYDSRNRANIAKLAPNSEKAALKFYQYCIDNKVDILIYETIRSEATQRANVAKGVSQTMRSYHLVGQALDFVPIKNGQSQWAASAYKAAPIQKVIKYAKSIGFEWGGNWTSLVDMPHLQYNYKGYGTDKKLASTSTAKKSTAKASTSKAKYPLPSGVLDMGSKGTAVKQLQQALCAVYFYPDKSAKNKGVDGIYGKDTRDAVKRFQSVYVPHEVDGVYGKNTKKALEKLLK